MTRQPETWSEILLGLLLVAPMALAIRGLFLEVLWRWFLTPLGIGGISFSHAIGLVAIVTYFRDGPEDDAKGSFTGYVTRQTVSLFVVTIFYLGYGAVAHFLM